MQAVALYLTPDLTARAPGQSEEDAAQDAAARRRLARHPGAGKSNVLVLFVWQQASRGTDKNLSRHPREVDTRARSPHFLLGL